MLITESLTRHRSTIGLGILLLCLVSVALYRPSYSALPETPRQIVLLVPGLRAADLQDAAHAPQLVKLARGAALALTPAPPQEKRPRQRVPVDACGRFSWAVPDTLGAVLPSVYVRDFTAADGYRTEPDLLANALFQAVQSPESPSVVAIFDDLCRNDRYAPLALPRVTRAERVAALKRLNRLAARLLELSDKTTLLLITTAPAKAGAAGDTSLFCPVLLRNTAGSGTAERALSSPTTGFTPGLLTRNDVAATVGALLDRPVAVSTGSPAVLLRQQDALTLLQQQERLWTWQKKLRSPGVALLFLLPVIAVLLAGAFRAAQGAIGVLRGVFLLTAVVLVLDTALGNPLLARTPFSHAVAEGGRIFGLAGAASGLLVSAAILGLALFPRFPEDHLLWGVSVVAALGLPSLGADTGGGVAALIGFAVTAIFWSYPEGWQKRLPVIGGGALLLGLGFLMLFLVQNGWQGVVAARLPGVFLSQWPWGVLLLVEVAICLWLWQRPDAMLHREEFIALLGVFAAAVAFLLLDNRGLSAAASCFFCILLTLLVANSPYWTQAEAPSVANQTEV